MKTKIALFVSTVLAAGTGLVFHAHASNLEQLQNAVKNGTTQLNFRYRYEFVDQDGIDKDANASTLKTRLSWKSGDFKGFFTKLEVDNVAYLGNDNFNNTLNGQTQYPVVADPDGTDLNQALIGYKSGNILFSMGRQRINHNDQRFVGGVGWRNNEQTFDGYRLQYNGVVSFDYSYVYNVNRIFGPDGSKADLNGDLHLVNSKYKVAKDQTLSAYFYSMDFDDAVGLSNRTLGIDYNAKLGPVKLHLAFANQSDTGDNPVDYSTNYWKAEVNTKVSKVNLGAGFETLGSDNGKGFVTPLATLHKFQGFADKFLATPGTGVEDLYVKASGKVGKLTLAVIWHDLNSESGSIDYGTELDLVAKYPLADKIGLVAKYASYSADELATDTDKFWLMVNVGF